MATTDFALALRLREFRVRRGWTLEQAAKRIGVTPTYLSSMENGKVRNPGLVLLTKAARTYGTGLDRLCGFFAPERQVDE